MDRILWIFKFWLSFLFLKLLVPATDYLPASKWDKQGGKKPIHTSQSMEIKRRLETSCFSWTCQYGSFTDLKPHGYDFIWYTYNIVTFLNSSVVSSSCRCSQLCLCATSVCFALRTGWEMYYNELLSPVYRKEDRFRDIQLAQGHLAGKGWRRGFNRSEGSPIDMGGLLVGQDV